MNFAEINQKSEAELRKELQAKREELAQLRVKLHLAQTKKVHEYRVLRKDIARIITALAQKQQTAANS